MKLKQKDIGAVTVLELHGDVLGGADATELNETLRNLVAGGKRSLVLDLSEVEYMNSSGLGMMTSALSSVKNSGAVLKLANPAERIKSLLVITKLIKVFESHDSVSEAVASFK
ncbi:MAG: STAS domain-containing protein [Rhizobacter sp.]|nr:STAS domain-containing protein [Chlorobiales bacterium]